MPEIGQTISHYKILEELGSGGMGVVYKALDTSLHRHVALKFLSVEVSHSFESLERFRHEAQAASGLNDPHICTIHAIEESEGRTFIVMELLDGMTLKDRIGSKPLPVEEVLEFGRQIAEGLDAAHSKGIIHRDIKPGNIFVTNRKQVKILDFGLAKLTKNDSESRKDAPTLPPGTGTLLYMSPEQALGKELDAKTDVWSLGVTLYQMATGTKPFTGKTPAAVFNEILHAEPVPPSKLNPKLPRKLDCIIANMLKKEASYRISSTRQVAAELADGDSELICLIRLDSTAFDREVVQLLNTWAGVHSMKIRYVLLTNPERHRIRAFEDAGEESVENIMKERATACQQKLGLSDESFISWDEICNRVNFKAAFGKIMNAYQSNPSFRDHCLSQAFDDLQPKFHQIGVQNESDARVRVHQSVRFLLEELALKVGAFESGEFHGEILPHQEMDTVKRMYDRVYFPCWVSDKGFEIISLSKSRVSHANYIHDNLAGMFGFVLQFYVAQPSQ